jgi:hypothetical protein
MKKYKKFFRFLKEVGVYKQYIKYTDFESAFHCRKNLSNFLSCADRSEFILDAFSWVGTPQGYRFWEKINAWWSVNNGELPADFKKTLRKLDNSKKQ